MMKILNIAWKDVYITFTDRNLLLLMLVTPLALSTIIALALGDAASGNNFEDIPIALVNLDQPGDGSQDYGVIYESVFIPGDDDAGMPPCEVETPANASAQSNMGSLDQLVDAELYSDAASAREAVSNGDLAAAIIIPEDFSDRLSALVNQPDEAPLQVEIFGDPNRPVSVGIIHSVVEGITNQILTGQIAIAATTQSFIANGRVTSINPGILACGFLPGFSGISIERSSVEGDEFDPLVVLGAAQAAFFALFTATGGASGILEERQNGTLQRMVVSPTSRTSIFLGKLLGVFVMVLLQLTFLFISFTIVGSLLDGKLSLIWGSNIPAIIALVLAMSLSAAGVGLITAALARSTEQANVIGGIIAMVMGILGGAFFSVDAFGDMEFITRISIVRWGSEAFSKLSNGHSDIGMNLAFLLVIGVILFASSLVIFGRRQDI